MIFPESVNSILKDITSTRMAKAKSLTTPDAGTDMVQLTCLAIDGSTENGEIFERLLIKINMNILLGTWLR